MGLLIFYALISIFFSFLCSILEAAFLSFTPTFIRIKKKEGKSYATILEHLKQDVDRPLITILTINTIAHTVGAILVGVQAEQVFAEGGNMVGIVSAIMTLAILILSEIIPKTIGATYWKSLGGFTAKTLKAFIFPLKYTGILWIMMRITRLVGTSAHGGTVSREEFVAITDAAEEEGVFKENESSVIRNILKFRSITAKDIMTPFTVATIENEATSIEEFYRKNHEELKFSRIPIYEETPLKITGFVLKDDVLEQMLDNQGPEPLKSIRKPVQVNEVDIPIPELFDTFVERRAHLSIIVDEFGNVVGLVTMEDIIETLLGLEIMDETDNIEDMQVLARKNWEKRAKKIGIIDTEKDQE